MCNLDPTYEQDDHRTFDAYMKEAEKIAEKKFGGETMASLYNKYKRARVANVEELRVKIANAEYTSSVPKLMQGGRIKIADVFQLVMTPISGSTSSGSPNEPREMFEILRGDHPVTREKLIDIARKNLHTSATKRSNVKRKEEKAKHAEEAQQEIQQLREKVAALERAAAEKEARERAAADEATRAEEAARVLEGEAARVPEEMAAEEAARVPEEMAAEDAARVPEEMAAKEAARVPEEMAAEDAARVPEEEMAAEGAAGVPEEMAAKEAARVPEEMAAEEVAPQVERQLMAAEEAAGRAERHLALLTRDLGKVVVQTIRASQTADLTVQEQLLKVREATRITKQEIMSAVEGYLRDFEMVVGILESTALTLEKSASRNELHRRAEALAGMKRSYETTRLPDGGAKIKMRIEKEQKQLEEDQRKFDAGEPPAKKSKKDNAVEAMPPHAGSVTI